MDHCLETLDSDKFYAKLTKKYGITLVGMSAVDR